MWSSTRQIGTIHTVQYTTVELICTREMENRWEWAKQKERRAWGCRPDQINLGSPPAGLREKKFPQKLQSPFLILVDAIAELEKTPV